MFRKTDIDNNSKPEDILFKLFEFVIFCCIIVLLYEGVKNIPIIILDKKWEIISMIPTSKLLNIPIPTADITYDMLALLVNEVSILAVLLVILCSLYNFKIYLAELG